MVFRERLGSFLGFGERSTAKKQPLNSTGQSGMTPDTQPVDAPERKLNAPEFEDLAEVSAEIVDVLRLQNAFEGPRRGLLDCDLLVRDRWYGRLLETYDAWFKSNPVKKVRQSFADSLDILREKVKTLSPQEDEDVASQIEFLDQKLEALSTYNRVIAGEQVPFREYIEKTQGITPEIIPPERLDAQMDVVKRLCARLGIEFSKDSIESFRRGQPIPIDQAPDFMKEKVGDLLPHLENFLGIKISIPLKIKIQDPPKDEYWFNWSNALHDVYTILVNPHPRHSHKFTKGKLEAMVSHEILGHLAQMTGWQKAIDEGELLRALGVTSINDPEQFTCEGIAQTLHHFVPGIRENLSQEALFELEMEGLRQMVYNNVHIMINSDDYIVSDINRLVRSYLPTEPWGEIRRQISERKRDDSRRSYLYAYGMGFLMHKEYAQRLDTEGSRKLIQYIYTRPSTPAQENRFVEQLQAAAA